MLVVIWEILMSQTGNNTKYCCSIYPGLTTEIPKELASPVKCLETVLEMPVWLLVQNDDNFQSSWSSIGFEVFRGFQDAVAEIEEGKPVCLLIDSPGGDADCAYRIARIFQRRTSHFTVLVPQYAKSAATLMALGGSQVILGRDAELGPLDVQLYDVDLEDYDSALNAVQSLERLNAFALTAFDQFMRLLLARLAKKVDFLLPLALNYATNMVRPLMEKIDTIDITKKSRELRVAEEYAIRLMRQNYSSAEARRIAGALVEKYPTHGFVIDREESTTKFDESSSFGLGLNISCCSPQIQNILDKLIKSFYEKTYVGRIKEMIL